MRVPGVDDAHHLAFHGALGLARLAALFADGDRLALADQLGQVGIEGDRGHTGHGNGGTRGGAALGERDVEQLRGTARVVVEHLVEIAHAIKQQYIGVLGFDAQVLLHHGGVCSSVILIHEISALRGRSYSLLATGTRRLSSWAFHARLQLRFGAIVQQPSPRRLDRDVVRYPGGGGG